MRGGAEIHEHKAAGGVEGEEPGKRKVHTVRARAVIRDQRYSLSLPRYNTQLSVHIIMDTKPGAGRERSDVTFK